MSNADGGTVRVYWSLMWTRQVNLFVNSQLIAIGYSWASAPLIGPDCETFLIGKSFWPRSCKPQKPSKTYCFEVESRLHEVRQKAYDSTATLQLGWIIRPRLRGWEPPVASKLSQSSSFGDCEVAWMQHYLPELQGSCRSGSSLLEMLQIILCTFYLLLQALRPSCDAHVKICKGWMIFC